MSTKIRIDDDIDVWIESGGGERPRGCQWDEIVCTEAPTHRVVPPEHNHHHDETRVYCGRHYALALARLVLVHAPACPHPMSAHVLAHGPATDGGPAL